MEGERKTEQKRTDLEETGGELLQLLAELVSDFRQPFTLLILQQQLLPRTHTENNTKQRKNEQLMRRKEHKTQHGKARKAT